MTKHVYVRLTEHQARVLDALFEPKNDCIIPMSTSDVRAVRALARAVHLNLHRLDAGEAPEVQHVDEFGDYYLARHVDSMMEEPPFMPEGVTHYERQEIKSLWVSAQRYARDMLSTAAYWVEELDSPEVRIGGLTGHGGRIPGSAAQDLTLALVKISEKLGAVQHRIAWGNRPEGEDWVS